MKIMQFHHDHRLKLGAVGDDRLYPLDFAGNMLEFIKAGPPVVSIAKSIGLDQIHFAPPVHNPSKIIAIGLNYLDHIRESKGEIPKTPLIFAKFPSALIGHQEAITWDTCITQKVDFEAELAVIIGRKTRHCPKEKALGAVFGYTCANDVSARDLQFGDRQWVRGKSLDTFCPLGPWIVTADEIPDPHQLSIQCRVNGTIMQASHTRQLVFPIPELISFLSQHFTLEPGDIILTGTPHGVGAFRDPAVYLHTGDEVTVEIQGIGQLINPCRESNSA